MDISSHHRGEAVVWYFKAVCPHPALYDNEVPLCGMGIGTSEDGFKGGWMAL